MSTQPLFIALLLAGSCTAADGSKGRRGEVRKLGRELVVRRVVSRVDVFGARRNIDLAKIVQIKKMTRFDVL